jgi:hypothetical protein
MGARGVQRGAARDRRVSITNPISATAASAIRQALMVIAPSPSRSCRRVTTTPPVPHSTPAAQTCSNPSRALGRAPRSEAVTGST